MQCKDIPDVPVLRFLAERLEVTPSGWTTWFDLRRADSPEHAENAVQRAMPAGVPAKLALAKMRQLLRRGLVDGCGCGCRGDFCLTEAGRAFLELRTIPT